jgi:hypothetical protein
MAALPAADHLPAAQAIPQRAPAQLARRRPPRRAQAACQLVWQNRFSLPIVTHERINKALVRACRLAINGDRDLQL